MTADLIYRLKKRAEIRRQIADRKSVREGKPDRIADLLEEAAQALEAPVQEPVAFKIYKPTPPRGATPSVQDAELPWVYDQDPSSGSVASMWVTPVNTKLKEKNTQKREHITDGSPCWCGAEVTYVDPETGVKIINHKEPQ